MRTDHDLAEPTIDLDEATSRYRISMDIDMVPAEMGAEQACGLIVATLESACAVVRAVRVNQCSALTKDGMHRRACDGTVSKITG